MRGGAWTTAFGRRAQPTRLLPWQPLHNRPRPLIVCALEAVSADWFYRGLAASLRRRPAADLRVMRLGAAATGSAPPPRSTSERVVLIGEFGAWAWQLEECDVLYLRPGLLLLTGMLPGIARTAKATRACIDLRCIDRVLSRHPILSLETLFHEPAQVAEFLKTRFSLDLEPSDFPPGGESAYREASQEMLRIVEAGPLAYNPAMLSFPAGRTYPTTVDAVGLLALSAGWSWPEQNYTWSDGPRASLAIPLAAESGSRLRLRLDGVLPPGPVGIRVFADGHLVATVEKREHPPRDQVVAFAVPQRPDGDAILSVELEFTGTFCPKDAGYSADDRHLGFALRSFTVSEGTGLAASLQSLIRWRSPRMTLALSMGQPAAAADIGGALADVGLSGALITVSDTREDQPAWREDGRAVAFPEFPAAAERDDRYALPAASPARAGDGLRRIAYGGTVPALLAELTQRGSFLDLVVLATAELFGGLLDALEPIVTATPRALPEIAICTDDAAVFNRSWWQHRTSYEPVINRFAAAMVDPQLISFVGRVV